MTPQKAQLLEFLKQEIEYLELLASLDNEEREIFHLLETEVRIAIATLEERAPGKGD